MNPDHNQSIHEYHENQPYYVYVGEDGQHYYYTADYQHNTASQEFYVSDQDPHTPSTRPEHAVHKIPTLSPYRSNSYLNSPTSRVSLEAKKGTLQEPPIRSYGLSSGNLPAMARKHRIALIVFGVVFVVGVIVLIVMLTLPRPSLVLPESTSTVVSTQAQATQTTTSASPTLSPSLTADASRFFPQTNGEFQAHFFSENCTIAVDRKNELVYVTNSPQWLLCSLVFSTDGTLSIRNGEQTIFSNPSTRQTQKDPILYSIFLTNEGLLWLQDETSNATFYSILPIQDLK
jgi:hypothetical protein